MNLDMESALAAFEAGSRRGLDTRTRIAFKSLGESLQISAAAVQPCVLNAATAEQFVFRRCSEFVVACNCESRDNGSCICPLPFQVFKSVLRWMTCSRGCVTRRRWRAGGSSQKCVGHGRFCFGWSEDNTLLCIPMWVAARQPRHSSLEIISEAF